MKSSHKNMHKAKAFSKLYPTKVGKVALQRENSEIENEYTQYFR